MFIYFILLICFYMLFFFFLFFKIFFVFFFFFSSRRRHTRYIGDWSSHVCSSDLDLYHWSFIAVLLCARHDRRLRRWGQRLAMTDQIRPSNQLVERPTQLAAQMPGDARCRAGQNQDRKSVV